MVNLVKPKLLETEDVTYMVDLALDKKQLKENSKHSPISNTSKDGVKKRSESIIKNDILVNLMNGIPLTKICSSPDFPVITTVYQWMTKDEEFAGQITQARMNGALSNLDKGYEEMERISNMKNKTHTDITLLNTKLTHLRWIASKIIPQFNDKIVNEHKGDVTYKIGWETKDPILTEKKKVSSHTT